MNQIGYTTPFKAQIWYRPSWEIAEESFIDIKRKARGAQNLKPIYEISSCDTGLSVDNPLFQNRMYLWVLIVCSNQQIH